MYPPERHREILHRTREHGRANVRDLARVLSVTPETIRRDLAFLERDGLVERVHGGAIAAGDTVPEPASVRAAAAAAIAQRAVHELPADGPVFLGGGEATARLAELLPEGRELTVVTPSIEIASLVAGHGRAALHLLGGGMNEATLTAEGPWALRAVSTVFVDVAFIAAAGVTADGGVTASGTGAAEVERALIGAARRTVVLADHTRFGSDAPAYVAGLDSVDLVLSDAGLDARYAEQITASGPRIELA
ncbi:DeoR family transcriptional regulator [Murinocardiopsis flavida]|uniref:Lactose phosphotransferase system repressor n=1 Tax=Murinocardiopsis flavida TaxID=645275 RepID=A0A2P8DEN9_9ACTN|nr:DeoR/GlpR family DNA-binding transcription regulator [Murinocardiopsis flavida]PSK95680.1 DeoR family transcriptional regulator [Murinocardiopsis flavida]